MNILQINNTDLMGARFNGYNLMEKCRDSDVRMKQMALDVHSDNPNVISLRDRIDTVAIYREWEARHSMRGVAIPYGARIFRHEAFQAADIVHYHLIHNHVLSLYDLPRLMKAKKSVWTIHDPWILTGHCVHPMTCTKFFDHECVACVDLEREFPMQEDYAHAMWRVKKEIFASLDVDIVVASQWMENLLHRSPLTRHWKKVHWIPFGIDLDLYRTDEKRKNDVRKRLGISEKDMVFFFRADRSLYKGLKFILKMLHGLSVSRRVVLLAVGEKGLLSRYRLSYKVLDFGWLHDEKELSDCYAAADIFLMPSVAETFGVMAIEAMAASLPVIVMEGTALPAVVDAPRCGWAFPCGDVAAFRRMVETLTEDEEKRREMGARCRKLTEEWYDENLYFSRMIQLYQEIHKSEQAVV